MNYKLVLPALVMLASCASADTPSQEDAQEFRESQGSVGLDSPLLAEDLTPGEMQAAFVCGKDMLAGKPPRALAAAGGAAVALHSYDKIFFIPGARGANALKIVKIRRDWDEQGGYIGNNTMIYPETDLTVDISLLCWVEELS